MTTNRNLTCCVCSDPAGRWAQHWNRDTGWGICTRCAAEQAAKTWARENGHKVVSDIVSQGEYRAWVQPVGSRA